MKYLYLQVLRFRVWTLRRRLRQMGFRDAADRTTPETIIRLRVNLSDSPKRHLRWFELVFIILGIFVWLIFDLRINQNDGHESSQKTSSSPAFPEVAPSHRKFSSHEEGSP
jgi:hypothetical protein